MPERSLREICHEQVDFILEHATEARRDLVITTLNEIYSLTRGAKLLNSGDLRSEADRPQAPRRGKPKL